MLSKKSHPPSQSLSQTGDFAAGTVSRWTADTIFLIERLITKSPVILVGSGVGGWISLLVASKRPDLVVRISSIHAPVPAR